MKKILIFSILLIRSLCGDAQSSIYHPFPADSAIWMQEHVDWEGTYTYQRWYMMGDTTLGSYIYKKIYITYATWASFAPSPVYNYHYAGAMRQDIPSKKVYYFDRYESSEKLLYNFDLQIGDIIAIDSISSFPNDTVRVNAIDSVLVNGSYNKKFILASALYPPGPGSPIGNLIEGVGSEAGHGRLYTQGFEHADHLICLSVSGQGYYPNGSSPANYCSYAVSINELIKNKLGMSVMPNPFSDKAFIEVKCTEGYSLEVMDNKGNLLYESRQLNDNGTNIELSDQPSGSYIIRITNTFGDSVSRKVIKN